MLYFKTQYINSPFILAFKSSLHFGDPDMIFFVRKVSLSFKYLKLVSTGSHALFMPIHHSRISGNLKHVFFFSNFSNVELTQGKSP